MADDYVQLMWRSDSPDLSLGLLQHYGIPTGAIDITYNPNIALWFATHSYFPETDTCCAHYRPSSSPGVVYLLDAMQTGVINLRKDKFPPEFGLRGVRQQGGLLLGATVEKSDLSHLIMKKLIVDHSVYESALIQYPNLTQDYLFPARENDEFYNTLLNEKASANLRGIEIVKYIVEYNSIPLPRWAKLDEASLLADKIVEDENMMRATSTLGRLRRLVRTVIKNLKASLR